jgi:hypothetical protein
VVVTKLGTKTVEYWAQPMDETTPGGVPTNGGPEGIGPGGNPIGNQAATGAQAPNKFKLRRYNFIIQFSWQQQPRGQRLEKMAQEAKQAASTAAASEQPATPGPSS